MTGKCGGVVSGTVPRDLRYAEDGSRAWRSPIAPPIDRELALKAGAKVARCCGRIVWNTVAQGDCVPCSEWFGDVLRATLTRGGLKGGAK